MNTITRSEHLAWCKERALAYVDEGDAQNAFASLISDLGKCSATQDHGAIQLGMLMLMSGQLVTDFQMREFINGCN